MAKIIRFLERLEEIMMVAGIVISVLILFFQIFTRTVFNFSLPWIEELARYLFIYFTWIGTSLAILGNKHIKVETFIEMYPKAKPYLEIAVTAICISISMFMLVNGAELLIKMSKFSATSPTMKIPMWICYMAIPLGGLLMTIKYLYKLVSIDIAELRKGAAG